MDRLLESQKTSGLTGVVTDYCGVGEQNDPSVTTSWHYRCKEWSAPLVCLFKGGAEVKLFWGLAFLIDFNSLLKVS